MPIDIEEKLHEWEAVMGLIVESAVFKDGNKWKDGITFYAEILHDDYINRVNRHIERFGKDDTITAKVKITQTGAFGSFKLPYQIMKVLEHNEAPVQDDLFR